MHHVLSRLATALVAFDHFGNPFHIARKRLLGKPSDLMTMVDRGTGVRCICTVSSHHMFGATWYTHVYDVPGVPIRPGDVVLDIGANQGFFTCYAAQKGAKVYAFEPVPELYERLLLNVEQNGFADRVTAVQCAVSDTDAATEIALSDSLGGGQSTIVPEFAKHADVVVSARVLVQCKTLAQILEDFSIQSVRLCKIDAEGAELKILRALQPCHLPRFQSFAMEYHIPAYDLRVLTKLMLSWGTHQVSLMGAPPYSGEILHLISNKTLATFRGFEPKEKE